jgi:hypothetical protein
MPLPLDALLSVAATVIGSVTVALVLDSIHSRRQRKSMLAALRSEISANLAVATRMKAGYETVFELSYFENHAYRNALSGGALASLANETFHDLSYAYDLMARHERQTFAISSEVIPRSAGYFERIALIETLLKKVSETTRW